MAEMQMRTEGPIKTRREGAILEVTLDAPKANAISLKTSRVMGLTFRDFRDDNSLRVCIIRAAGYIQSRSRRAMSTSLQATTWAARRRSPSVWLCASITMSNAWRRRLSIVS